jgi:beta-glucosidase
MRRTGLIVVLVLVGMASLLAPQAQGAVAATRTEGGSETTQCHMSSFSLVPLARARREAAQMLARMSLDEEVTLMHGVGDAKAPSGTVGATAAIPSQGIPAINEQDGPAGIGDGATGVTQLPAPESLAATFDPTAASCYGQVIGTEARGKGINLVYGPTVNIVRVPEWGRAFEALGEDPTLTGTVGSAEVRGIQRSGTMAQVKHFAVYNQETNRLDTHNDSVVSEKALQEIYLSQWRAIVAASPSSIMCAYSTINGAGACQNHTLIDGFLDGTLEFPGFVGSDYYATHSTVTSVEAGLDQEQPTGTYFGTALMAAVDDGQVSRATVHEATLRILTEMYRFRLFSDDAKGSIHHDVATQADATVSNEVAEEGTVLLKDAGHTLPLRPGGGAVARGAGHGGGDVGGGIAVLGPAAQTDPVTAGGGSATVAAAHVVTPLQGIRSAVGRGRPVTYAAGLPGPTAFSPIPSNDLGPATTTPSTPGVLSATLTVPVTGTYELAYSEPPYFVPVTLAVDGTPVTVNPGTPPRSTFTATLQLTAGRTYTLTGPVQSLTWVTPGQISQALGRAADDARRAATAVVVVGDGQESEGADRVNLTLPSDQDALVRAIAAANRHTVVVVDAGAAVTMPWLPDVAAVVDAWYPGQTDGTALAAVLFGRVDPSGHLPITFPTTATRTPVSTPSRFPGTDQTVEYAEGVDVGYRWYDATGTTPLFPFGFGLSYTTFRYSAPSLQVAQRRGRPVVTASVRITNAGSVAGADVAQLYLGQPAAAANPPRQLEAFHRVSLPAGSSTTVTFTLGARQLASYDAAVGAWRVAPGTYRVFMGDSSALAQLPVRARFHLATGFTPGR